MGMEKEIFRENGSTISWLQELRIKKKIEYTLSETFQSRLCGLHFQTLIFRPRHCNRWLRRPRHLVGHVADVSQGLRNGACLGRRQVYRLR